MWVPWCRAFLGTGARMDWPPLSAEEGCQDCQALQMDPGPVHSGRLGKQRQVVHLTTRAQLDFMLHCGDRMAACALILSPVSILQTH